MLRIHVQKLGNVAILCVQGGIVIGQTMALADAVNSQTGVNAVVLDLTGVSRVDARGLGVMLELREQTQSKGIDLKLMNVTKFVQEVLDLTRLNTVFRISTEHEVLSTLAKFRSTEVVRIVPCAQAA